MAAKSHTNAPIAALAAIVSALLIGLAPIAALFTLSARIGGVQ